jgi:hypothetical protein
MPRQKRSFNRVDLPTQERPAKKEKKNAHSTVVPQSQSSPLETPSLESFLRKGEMCKFPTRPCRASFVPANTAPDPPLPPLADLARIVTLYKNGTVDQTVSMGRKNDRSGWHGLESLGDGAMLCCIRSLLMKMFGWQSPVKFLKLLEDHAKSNSSCQQLGKLYSLDMWVEVIPTTDAHWANIFEVYIGSLFTDREAWDGDALGEIESWLQGIWSIRYRDLHQYVSSPFSLPPAPQDRSVSVATTEIIYPETEAFARCKLRTSGTRPIGYIAKASHTGSELCVEAFHSVKAKAEENARRLLNRISSSDCLIIVSTSRNQKTFTSPPKRHSVSGPPLR